MADLSKYQKTPGPTPPEGQAETFRRPTKEEVEKAVTRLRHRGMVNTMLDGVAQAFAKAHPELGVKWEYAPSAANNFEITTAKAMGYREVMVEELPPGVATPHSLSSGPVRTGDLILMAAPREIHEAYLAEDFRAAAEEADLPVEEYRRTLRGIPPGAKGSAVGGVKQTVEYVGVDLEKVSKKAEEGGE